ncbi:homeobox-leucine zipper protein ATHB-21-like [Hibiscus syriacus]|uniref:Homeobox-leucine zipper protein ATHB-21-like n=1 Tax=Hibiscus syriacus TaxID=106335 RepID=A0A6A2ZZ05_HIBSY|nr:homeobox-leucine zipper protein ATHB-21-like [Hibiscus syriacus]
MFLILYLIAYFIVFRSWSPKIRPEASSCFISLFHGTPAVFLATFAILLDQNRGFSSSNTETQNLVLDYSIAYFLTDLLHYLIFPFRHPFHCSSFGDTLRFVTCRHVVFHGSFAILSLLILAEVTSFCQNVWTLATARRHDNELAARLFVLIPLFLCILQCC